MNEVAGEQTTKEANVGGGLRFRVTAEQRTGFCEICGTQVEKQFYMDGEVRRAHVICPKCGGMGKLIVKTFSIQPPAPPKCLSFRCITKFFNDSIRCALLTNYHKRRVAYATHNRKKKMLEKYRTGEPSPTTFWGIIYATVKLSCPIWRNIKHF